MRGASTTQQWPRRLADLHDQLDLHRGAQRQLGDTDRRTRMGAAIAEHLGEQFGGTVDDARLAVETRCGGDEPDDLDHPGHRVDAHQRIHRRQRIEHADPRQRLSLFGADVDAHLAAPRQLAVLDGHLTRGEDEVAGANRRNIGGQRRHHLWQCDTEFPEPGRRSHAAAPCYFGRFRYATCCSPVGPGSTATSSQPSAPHWSRICLVAWVSSGTVAYSHVVGWLISRAYRQARRAIWLACRGG